MIATETARIILRQWREQDILPFARMNSDPKVMRYFPTLYSEQKTRSLVKRVSADIARTGWGFWAAERKDSREFIGFIGINPVQSGLPFAPCVDIGWRLATKHWGLGLATEGALAALAYGFEQAHLNEIVSMTPTTNHASERVMQKIGMHKAELNFMHPEVLQSHSLCEHVLYRLTNQQWRDGNTLTAG